MTEDAIQRQVADYLKGRGLLFTHPPNGSFYGGTYKTRMKRGAKMKAHGVSAGVPDILIFTRPRIGDAEVVDGVEVYDVGSGMAIELKKPGNYPTPAQREWLKALEEEGWVVAVCRSLEEVQKLIDEHYG